jgi:hypothetical protein
MKLKLTALLTAAFLTSSAYAANFDLKLGAGYAMDQEKTGVDASLGYYLTPDPYFNFGPEISAYWLNYDVESAGATAGTVNVTKNSFWSFPALLNAKIKIPMGGGDFSRPMFEPYVKVGAGWGFSSWNINSGTDVQGSMNGLVYQVAAGSTFRIGSGGDFGETSAVKIIAEVAYRYFEPDLTINNTTTRTKLTGITVHTGLQFDM